MEVRQDQFATSGAAFSQEDERTEPRVAGEFADVEEDEAEPEGPTAKRQRSEIAFPYADLDDAVQVAKAIWSYGGECDVSQLSATLDQKPTSGAFRIKVTAARTFGLMVGSRGSLRLSALGRQIVDDQTADAAKVEAFLTVPLYQRIFAEVSAAGGLLPEDDGLEEMARRLGVVSTQADRARQTFQRSARQAGFHKHGPRRLVRPAVGSITRSEQVVDDNHHSDAGKQEEGDQIGMKPALITELFRQLPDEGQTFPAEKRKLWETVFQASLNLVYGEAVKDAANSTETAGGSRPL